LFAGTHRIENVPGQTTCGGQRGEQGNAERPVPKDREKAIKAVEALGAFSEWANGRTGKDKTEYLIRLTQLEALVGGFLTSTAPGDKSGRESQPAGAINAALNCFEDAAGLWPRVTEVWATADRNVRKAERGIGVKSSAEKRELERLRQAQLERMAEQGAEKERQELLRRAEALVQRYAAESRKPASQQSETVYVQLNNDINAIWEAVAKASERDERFGQARAKLADISNNHDAMLKSLASRREHEATVRAYGWPKSIEEAVLRRQIVIGMTTEQVQLAWGDPERIHETLRASGKSEMWVYPTRESLFFENGKLLTIQRTR
jgi:hypothetical protein